MRRFLRWLVLTMLEGITAILFRIEKDELDKIPASGPMILAMNHIGSLEVPLLRARVRPRRVVSLAKIETWDNKLVGWLFDLWESIPIHRGEVDLWALRRCLTCLSAGDLLGVAPEGTRSYDGNLLSGRPGIVLIGLHSGAPILPVVHWGVEDFPKNIKHLKRTKFHIRVGKPFTLDSKGEKVNGRIRQKMADEIMFQIANLMPEKYRGKYALNPPPPMKYLRFT
ncbi:MAG: lysophospholipid acyltransferase family protein [Anaerolineales bacterium]